LLYQSSSRQLQFFRRLFWPPDFVFFPYSPSALADGARKRIKAYVDSLVAFSYRTKLLRIDIPKEFN